MSLLASTIAVTEDSDMIGCDLEIQMARNTLPEPSRTERLSMRIPMAFQPRWTAFCVEDANEPIRMIEFVKLRAQIGNTEFDAWACSNDGKVYL